MQLAVRARTTLSDYADTQAAHIHLNYEWANLRLFSARPELVFHA
jgi:hypothetical protein